MSAARHSQGEGPHWIPGPSQRGWIAYTPLWVGALALLLGVALPSHAPAVAVQGLSQQVERLHLDVASIEENALSRQSRFWDPDWREIYLVVDTRANRLTLYQGSTPLRDAVVSTGSGSLLRSPDGLRQWVFHTPRGVRRVEAKQQDPIWYKPDWAFLEEGLPIPPPRDPSRVVKGRLGAYALDLGDQIKIHGTLEKEKLGSSVSHGCIRVGDEDLEVLYHVVPVGARVFFY